MKNIIKRIEKREVEEVTSILCNKCGKEIQRYDNYCTVKYSGGYGSKIGDGAYLEFDLCDDCLIDIKKDFKIPAEVDWSGFMGGGILDKDGKYNRGE
jgi:hypothetical protein